MLYNSITEPIITDVITLEEPVIEQEGQESDTPHIESLFEFQI